MSTLLDEAAEQLTDPLLWLTEEEMAVLMLSACDQPGGATEAQMTQVVHWAVNTRMQARFLEMVLSGQLRVKAGPGDDVSFSAKEKP